MGKFGFWNKSSKTRSKLALYFFAATIAWSLQMSGQISAQTFTPLAKFNGVDGQGPYFGPLVQGMDGNFYGTTEFGGAHQVGSVFEVTPEGKLITVYSFCSQPACVDGTVPYAGLLQLTDGNLYGTTAEGGANDSGTLFELTPAGQLTTLHSFCSQPGCADGQAPIAQPIEARNGDIYGTTSQSVSGAVGTIFKITPTGGFTTVFSTNNSGPNLGVIQGESGNFYGINENGGGAYGDGSVFELSMSGEYTTLFSFDGTDGLYPNLLIQGADGNFYGTTEYGGANNSGSIFKLTPAGEFTTLYNFCSQPECADGVGPRAGLVQGTDGNFYGSTTFGGAAVFNGQVFEGYGTLFQLTPAGQFTSLHTFCSEGGDCSDGAYPYAPLVQGTDGNFYGTTYGLTTCPGNCGTVYKLSMGLKAFVKANPNFSKVGRVVDILGNKLKGTTGVTFNSVAATFDVVSSNYIKAMVPDGATAGPIEVTTTNGTLVSDVNFQIEK